MSARAIDLNADVGEDPAAAQSGAEAALLDAVTSVNVACGGHAGDDDTMRAVLALAAARRLVVGAHPGYPDREHFGREDLRLPPAQVEATVVEQIVRLARLAAEAGVTLRHVKPHGALYHAAMARSETARAIARAVRRVGGDLMLVGPAGAPGLEHWRAAGFRVAAEAFADRRYEPDGTLRDRSLPGAVIADPAKAAAQAVRIAREGGVVASDGTLIAIEADTFCVHGDTPGAAAVARAVREALVAAGVAVRAPRGP